MKFFINIYSQMPSIEIQNMDGLEYLKTIDDNSIDLILTDPPYIISRETGMDIFHNKVTNLKELKKLAKTEKEWEEYKRKEEKKEEEKEGVHEKKNKENFLKYGTIYGKKYSVKTNYGDWDCGLEGNFTMSDLKLFINQYYKKLKQGGTLIIFFDLWKMNYLKEIMEENKFKQIRFIEWIKTNPQPLNSKTNYLTNCREIALVGVKGTKPTFNSSYDKGIYEYPIQSSNRIHPTQKSLKLFEELVTKHSRENDTVLDTFLGGGTTAIACKNTNRNFKGCEKSKEFFEKIQGI